MDSAVHRHDAGGIAVDVLEKRPLSNSVRMSFDGGSIASNEAKFAARS